MALIFSRHSRGDQTAIEVFDLQSVAKMKSVLVEFEL